MTLRHPRGKRDKPACCVEVSAAPMNAVDTCFAWLNGAPPLAVWGVFTRLVGLVFLISFGSLHKQLIALAGEQGLMPVEFSIGKIRRDFPTWRRFFYFPTLLWVSPRNVMLRSLLVLGVLGATSVIIGGPWSPYGIAACYIVYISLDKVVGLVYPWDSLLFEMTFLGLFLPPTHLLPDISAVTLPAPALAWAYRLLLLRVMLGFGKFKFFGSTQEDSGYLSGFLINQPLATKLGWYFQKAPIAVLKVALIAMFIAEIPVPFMLLGTGTVGILGGIITGLLMVGIWLTGNFGYFNLAMIALCVVPFDTLSPTHFHVASMFAADAPRFTNAVLLVHFIGALLVFPLNSFTAQSWSHWPLFMRVRPKLLKWPIDFFRALQPIRCVHPYGVFPPKTMPPVKCVAIMEATWDGEHWEECKHPFSPTAPNSQPRFVAPHHPRGDQAVVYETFGLRDSSMLHGMIGSGNPYGFSARLGVLSIAQRVLEGYGPLYGDVFFTPDTFPATRPPPKALRMRTHMLLPTTHAQHVATGNYWTREPIGPHMPVTHLDPLYWEELLDEPEMWHWEDIIWKRRSKLSAVTKRLRAGENPHTAVLAETDEISAADLDLFWGEFLVRVREVDRSDWQALPDLVDGLRARYGRKQLRKHERILGRYGFMLHDKLDPLFLDSGLMPIFGVGKAAIDVKSYMHLGMLVHIILVEGKDAFERVLREPLAANDYVSKLSISTGLYMTGIFRFDTFVFEAQKMRLLKAVMEPKRVQFSLPDPKLTAALDEMAKRAFGVVEVIPFLCEQFKGPRFDGGEPENYPLFEMSADGVAERIVPELA
jgi:hypothetical protein